MKRIAGFFSKVKRESGFIQDQFSKIIWPKPMEAANIFCWTFSMLVIFGLMITFVFDPAAIALVSFLSSLSK